ncbi:MAG: Flp pilus assembly complex ATPase component TadA [Clostridia bacterium]|nr:Flp pilus assembly complex ATPase component TadA [Clostridia bacterium]
MIDIEKILADGVTKGASDIHIVEGSKPLYRINRTLVEVEEVEEVNEKDIFDIFEFFINDNPGLRNMFQNEKKLDLNFQILGARLRINVSSASGLPIFTARIINNKLPRFNDLGLPDVVRRTASLPQGLILVTGKSNSGKSTTLNALINEINRTENRKILTLENPIEYLHQSDKSLIIQKEVGEGKDCLSFSDGAINALREDCDIVVIGEIRDKNTIDAALELAESGHLVIGTMHTRSAAETIDRILGFYDLSDQLVVKYIVSSVLKAVISQRLINGNDNNLVMVPEIMIVDDVISGLIRKEKFSKSEIEDAIQTRMERGSISFINSLANAVSTKKISLYQAKKQLDDAGCENLTRILGQINERKLNF